MGQRTQALVTINYKGKLRTSVSIHYQWGYGRVMLMDLLNLVFQITNKTYDYEEFTSEELAEVIFTKSCGSINFCDWSKEGELVYKTRNGVKAYDETLKDVIGFSDNNDGFAHLRIVIERENFSVKRHAIIGLYNTEGNRCSLKEFCESGKEFADRDFKKGIKTLFESYGVNLQEGRNNV